MPVLNENEFMGLSRIDMFMQRLDTFLNSYSEMQANHFICLLFFFFQPLTEKNAVGFKYLIFCHVCDVLYDCHIWLFDFLW